jgi:hypothetical protein
MKTVKLLSLFVLLMVSKTVVLSQVLYSEDFDNVPGKTQTVAPYNFPAEMSLFNVDAKTPDVVSYVNAAWIRREDFSFNSADSCAFSTSYYSPVGAADDWMFTPAIVLPTSVITLSWNAVSYDNASPDGYEVRVMTVAPTLSNINTSAVVFSTTAENSIWTSRTVDISSYAGQTIYVGFRNNSNNMYLLAIDDIVVTASTVTSVNETAQKSDISILPNPATTHCTISNIPDDVTTLNIYNTLGIHVKTIAIANASTYSLDLTDLNTGTYFINLSGAQTNETLKLIKK